MVNQSIAAVYVRVSTADQNASNQLAACVRIASQRGWQFQVFEEIESAARPRAVFEDMLGRVMRGDYCAIVAWSLDRLSRSMVETVSLVLDLDRRGVPVVSVQEPWLDLAGPVRSLLLAVFGWVAEQERSRLRERTKLGLARARREGKTLGRPATSIHLVQCGFEKVDSGIAVDRAARECGLSATTLRRHLALRNRHSGAVHSGRENQALGD